MKSAVCALLASIVLTTVAFGIEVKPVNISIPSEPNGIFSFDFIVTAAPTLPAFTAQLTIDSISQAGLTLNTSASNSVLSNPNYWVFGNSQGTPATDNGDGSFAFGDGPEDSVAETINNGDILARFAFTWSGPAGDFSFNLALDTDSSYARLENFTKTGFTLPTGQWYEPPIISSTASGFTVHIPEPVSFSLLGLGGLFLVRKRFC